MKFAGTEVDKTAVGIYEIVNTKTGMKYIGQTKTSFWRRYREHSTALRQGRHPNTHLQQAWNTDGGGAFVFAIVRCIRTGDSMDFCWWEHHYIKMAMERGIAYNKTAGYEIAGYNENDYWMSKVEDLIADGRDVLSISAILDLPLAYVMYIMRSIRNAS